jgi:hypothetical protein
MLRPDSISGGIATRMATSTFVTGRILFTEGSNPLNERLHAPLLKDAHQRRPQGLASIRGHLRNCSLGASALLHKASCYLSKLEVSSNIGGYEDICQFPAGHEEFRHEIDVPVVDTSILLPWLLALVIVAVLLEELIQVRGNLQGLGKIRTASILTEAASLPAVSLDNMAKVFLKRTLRSDHFCRCARPSCP